MGYTSIHANNPKSDAAVAMAGASPEKKEKEKRAYYRRAAEDHINKLRRRGASEEEIQKFRDSLSSYPMYRKEEPVSVKEALFDVLYSTEIPECIKEAVLDVVNCYSFEISESYVSEEVNSFIEFLDSMVYSSASEELIEEVLDEALPYMSEDFINEVSDEWVNRKVQDSLAARKSAADATDKSVKSGLVGLSQLRNQDQAHQHLDAGKAKAASIQARLDKRTPTTSSTGSSNNTDSSNPYKPKSFLGDKLKSVVGKVKGWWEKTKSTGSTLGKGSTEAESPRAKKINAARERAKGEKIRKKREEVATSLDQAFSKENLDKINKRKEEVAPEQPAETTTVTAEEQPAKKRGRKPRKVEGEQPEVAAETTTSAPKKPRSTSSGKGKTATKGGKGKTATKMANGQPRGRSRKTSVVAEALSDLAILLLNTNISESCYVEVMEMVAASAENIKKIQARYDNRMENAINTLDQDVREKGEPDPEHVKEADSIAKRKEKFEQMARNKFKSTN